MPYHYHFSCGTAFRVTAFFFAHLVNLTVSELLYQNCELILLFLKLTTNRKVSLRNFKVFRKLMKIIPPLETNIACWKITQCLIGSTSSFMVGFPVGHVSFWGCKFFISRFKVTF